MNRPEIVAHRGASRERPENTLAAFRRALDLGADAVELDVHLTSDGILIVHHDPVPGEAPSPDLAGMPIGTLTAEALSRYRVRTEPIPTLAEVVESIGLSLGIYCELKGPATAVPATALLGSHVGRSAVHAFDHRQVAAALAAAPSVPRGVLEVSYHVDPVAEAAFVDARDVWQQWELIDEDLIHAVHQQRRRVVAWTVNSGDQMLRLAELGVDALCTDDVALATHVFMGATW